MSFKQLSPLLGAILLAALAYAFWPEVPPAPAPYESPNGLQPPVPTPRAPMANRKLPPDAMGVRTAPPPNAASPGALSPSVAPPTPAAAPPAAEPIAQRHFGELGVPNEELEPLDGGVLHKLDRDGIRGAVQSKIPEIRECYEGWLQQNPSLQGKIKVEFLIAEIPGRDRGKVVGIQIADGGMGHLAMEGCVGNVFKTMRFEAPRGGELRVTYPLQFSNTANENAPPP